jgi:hypothetical protein
MILIPRFIVTPFFRLAFLWCFAALLSGCSTSGSSGGASASEKKKGWTSLLPWGGKAVGGDATPYLEYQRTREEGKTEPLYTLFVRNTHMTGTIEGEMRTTLETGPGDMKMDNQAFTLAPNEQKRLLVYPSRFPLTYEVTASFRE